MLNAQILMEKSYFVVWEKVMRKYLGTGWICDKNLENKIIYGNEYIYTLYIYKDL